MQAKKQNLSSPSTKLQKKMAIPSSQLPQETPDYAGGRGFKVPQPAEALAAARMIPEFIPPPQSQAPSVEHANINTTLRPLRTYRDDLASVLSLKQSSMVSIALAEQKKQILSPNTSRQERRILAGKHTTSLGLNIVLICLGGIMLGAVYMLIQLRVRPMETGEVPSIVARNERVVVDVTTLTPDTSIAALRNHMQRSPLATNNITHVVLTEVSPATTDTQSDARPISTDQFLSLIGAKPPQTLLRSLDQTFMLGIHQTDKPNPFIIFRTTFFGSAFSEMFRWESSLATELAPLFGIHIPETAPKEPGFADLIIENRDARALRNEEGAILLLYSFIDQTTLLITTDTETVREVFSRLTSIKVIE